MNSASPSQLSSGFGSFGSSGINNLVVQQRPYQSTMPTSQPMPTQQSSSRTQSPNRFFGNGPPRGLQLPSMPPPSQNTAVTNQGRRLSALANINAPQANSPFTAYGRPLGTENGVPSFDLSEFPSLGNRNAMSAFSSSAVARNYVNVMNKPIPDTSSEFQIQPEEFPALPGKGGLSGIGDRRTPSDTTGFFDQSSRDKSGQNSRKGIQTHADGTITNIPSSMVMDQFGMVGLLTFIRTAEKDPNMVPLAPGIDLTTLGLNLNSPDNLYSTFQSPWSDSPCRPQDIDFHVPNEYLTNINIKDKLAPLRLSRYGENLLFFLFYMNGGDFMQLAAAAELHNRDWRYHKEEKVWISRIPGRDPETKTQQYERGLYYYFDPQNWIKGMKPFHLEYDKLEDKPSLPSELIPHTFTGLHTLEQQQH